MSVQTHCAHSAHACANAFQRAMQRACRGQRTEDRGQRFKPFMADVRLETARRFVSAPVADIGGKVQTVTREECVS